MTKKIMLVVLVVLIVGAIWYLESMKVRPLAAGVAQSVTPLSADNAATTTSENGQTITNMQTLQSIITADQKAGYQPAIEISSPTGFINVSSTFTLQSLVGKKVVLLDFWTYSCINCIRTLPYLTAWDKKYAAQGLMIVGIHTPEFDFEKDINNVQAAVQKYGINYPVILDSDYGTWQAYNNLYWPHEYLIDIAGYIVHDHVGEGGYDETEGIIQQLLAQRKAVLGTDQAIATSTVNVAPADLSDINSPETYFGAARNELLANGPVMTTGVQSLTLPANTPQINRLYLGGTWNFQDQYATNVSSGAKIVYQYNSDKVYIVASSGTQSPVTVEVLQDGKPVTAANAGDDVINGKATITGSRLYNLIKNPSGGIHTLELIIDQPGLNAFTFTFG